MHEPRHHIPVRPADLYLRARFEHQKTFSIGMWLDLTHLIQIYDGRAVDALEGARVEPLLEILPSLTQD